MTAIEDVADAGRPADRIPLVYRTGMTGHRWVKGHEAGIGAAVDAALAAALARCAYRSTPHTPVIPAVVSSLAEGSDRLAAAWAVREGVRLEVVLPLEPADYLEDFATESSRAEFRRLVDAAALVSVVERQATRDAAYRRAGQVVVDRSDALVAIWDGEPERGDGGTAEIVRLAAQRGVPVSWLHVRRHEGGVSCAPGDLRAALGEAQVRESSPLSPAAFALLDRFNRADVSPGPAEPLGPECDADAHRLAQLYLRADLVAVRQRDTLRRANRALYALAVVAVAVAAGQLVFFPEHPELVWIEFGALVLIVAILLRARRARLLDRWISTRALAERLRSAFYLTSIGASHELPTTPAGEEDTTAMEWARRVLREALIPVSCGPGSPLDLEAGRTLLLDLWIDPQLDYHRAVSVAASTYQRRSTRVAVGLFGVSLVAAVLHARSALTPAGAPDYWGYISIVVPAAGAAVSGYTAQREYVRQRSRAAGMVQRLTLARAAVVGARTAEDLHRAGAALDLVIQGETADWFAAMRVHEPEVP